MSIYKEFFVSIDYGNRESESPDITTQTSPGIHKEVRTRGSTHTLSNEIIYVTIENNLIKLVSLSTQIDNVNQNMNNDDLVKTYQFSLPSLILDSVTIINANKAANSYFITVFTDNGHIQRLFKEPKADFTILRGSYQDNLNIVSVEYIYTTQSSLLYALGSSTGQIYLMSLIDDNGRLVLLHKQTINLSSNKSLFRVFQEQIENGINSMKYLGNNLLCCLDTLLMFTVYDINTKRVIYSNLLLSNEKEELLSSKIIFEIVDFSRKEIEGNRIFNVLFYLEYSNTYEVVSLELWFKNIPECLLMLQSGMTIEDQFARIELGNDLSIKSKKVYLLKGQLIDMNIQNGKLWLIVENKRKTMNHIQEIPLESQFIINKDFIDKFSIDILTLQPIDITCEDNAYIQFNSDDVFDYKEKKLKQVFNILYQINSNTSLALIEKKELCLSLLTNEEYFEKETLIKAHNEVFKQKFSNKSEVIDMLKHNSDIPLDEVLIPYLINEELNCNKISLIGCFKDNQMLNLGLIRQRGIGVIRPIGFFERIDQEIYQHEYHLRNIITNHRSDLNHCKKTIEEKVEEYALIECKYNQSNALYIIFALIRIYLTESNLLLTNEDYLIRLFQQYPSMSIISLIKNVFEDNLLIQSNNLTFLEFIHLILKDLINNNSDSIVEGVNAIMNEYVNIGIKTEDLLSKTNGAMEDGSSSEGLNDIYCKIVFQIAMNKISGMFHVSRDLMALLSWKKVYSEYEEINDAVDNINEESIRLLFIETFASYLFSNHLTNILLTNSIRMTSKTLIKEIKFLDQLVLDNLSKYKVDFLRKNNNENIDILIKMIMPDFRSKNESIVFLYQKAYLHGEFGLLLLLTHITSDSNSLQSVFLDILCKTKQTQSTKQNNSNSISKEINAYYLNLLNMINTSDGQKEFEQFELFYHSMCLESSDFQPFKNCSILIRGYYYIENQLLRSLKQNEMTNFYLQSFNWIYPKLQEISKENKEEDKEINAFISKFINSEIQVDAKYAFVCYNTIKQSNKSQIFIANVIESFTNYLMTTIQFKNKTSFVSLLIDNDYELLSQICLNLEKKCMMTNTELQSLLSTNSNKQQEQQSSSNLFYFLFSIYFQMKDYQLACSIMFKYARVLQTTIDTDNFPAENMIYLYQEKIATLNNVIIMLKKCHGSNQYFLYDRQPELKPVLIEDLIKEKNFAGVKVVLLKKYNSTKELKEVINEEMISKIKKDNCLLNLIFQMRMYDLITGMNMISFVSETQGKIMIYNFISNLLRQCDNSDSSSNSKQEIDYEMIKVFIDQVKESQCDEFAYQALEALLYFHSQYQIDELIVSLITI